MNATLINRSLSLIIGTIHIGCAASQHGFNQGFLFYSIVIIALVCMIWFGDAIGEFSGYFIGHSVVNTQTPGWMVCFMGWLFLVGTPVVVYLIQ